MQVKKDTITLNEVENDGKTIHLYFDKYVGLYTAYGFSAFFVSHIVDVMTSFSEELQMPVTLLKRADVEELKLSTTKIQHEHHFYYRLELKHELDLDDYERWAVKLKNQ